MNNDSLWQDQLNIYEIFLGCTETASYTANDAEGGRIVAILLAYSLFYLLGVLNANSEYNIARYTLTPMLRKILFFNRTRFTLVNIISQVYITILTILSVAALLLPLGISPDRVGELYIGLLFWPNIFFQIIIVSRRRHW